jgi:hypothetical protein
MPTPTILLAFANDWSDDKRHLRSLLEESKAIGDALSPLVEVGLLIPPPIHNAKMDDVMAAFRARRHRDRIRIFHFGGHASGATLLFEDHAGQPTGAHACGLAGYLGRQPRLVLVFLNGCCTEPQVRQLRQAGVKAVVATTRAIQDEVAAEFARTFYAELCARPLRDAFDTTVQAIRAHRGDDPQGVHRDVVADHEREPPGWPWILDSDPAFDAWSLGSEVTRGHLRTWRGRLLPAFAAISLLLLTSLAVSAGARRAMCQARGLRSLCASIGIGNVPTAAEQALWDESLAQRTGDGLRAYLRSYPEGTYTDEARSRLAACKTERVERWGSEKDIPYRWTVNVLRAHPLPTEDAARRNAVERGNEDAKDHCRAHRRTGDLLSAHAEPHSWMCIKLGDGFTCGFDGDIVCHVRDRILTDDERCR